MSNDEIERLAADLGQRLIARGWRVATAESCTGGLVAGAVTAALRGPVTRACPVTGSP